jgi:hypothetical protein
MAALADHRTLQGRWTSSRRRQGPLPRGRNMQRCSMWSREVDDKSLRCGQPTVSLSDPDKCHRAAAVAQGTCSGHFGWRCAGSNPTNGCLPMQSFTETYAGGSLSYARFCCQTCNVQFKNSTHICRAQQGVQPVYIRAYLAWVWWAAAGVVLQPLNCHIADGGFLLPGRADTVSCSGLVYTWPMMEVGAP